MGRPDLKRVSRFIALVLRHKPEVAGLALDPEGWAWVDDLLRGLEASGRTLSRAELEYLVGADAKGRYALSAGGLRIRARHLEPVDDAGGDPPVVHGTRRVGSAA